MSPWCRRPTAWSGVAGRWSTWSGPASRCRRCRRCRRSGSARACGARSSSAPTMPAGMRPAAGIDAGDAPRLERLTVEAAAHRLGEVGVGGPRVEGLVAREGEVDERSSACERQSSSPSTAEACGRAAVGARRPGSGERSSTTSAPPDPMSASCWSRVEVAHDDLGEGGRRPRPHRVGREPDLGGAADALDDVGPRARRVLREVGARAVAGADGAAVGLDRRRVEDAEGRVGEDRGEGEVRRRAR